MISGESRTQNPEPRIRNTPPSLALPRREGKGRGTRSGFRFPVSGFWVLASGFWVLGSGFFCSCGSSPRPFDIDDVDVPVPGAVELESRLKAYRSGTERLHGDPKQVSHVALLHHLDLPWRGDPYRPEDYEFHERNPEHPEWGSYVVRGWVERTGSPRVRRYRVKIRPYEEIWYATQVSHYILVDVPEDGPNERPPDVRK